MAASCGWLAETVYQPGGGKQLGPQLPQGAVIMVGGDKESYIRGLRQARGELPTPPGQNGNGNGHMTPSKWTSYGSD